MKKWIPNVFLPHEGELLANYLENQAAKGWILEKVGQIGFWLKKSEPRTLRYCVDIPSTQRKRGGRNDYLQPYYEMCEAAGWSFVGTNMLTHVFVTEDLMIPPIQTDPSVQFDATHSFLKERVGIAAVILVLLMVLVLPTLPWIWQEKNGMLLTMAAVVLLGFLYVRESIYSFYQWKRRQEQAYITGDWNTSIHQGRIIVRIILRGIYTLGVLVAYGWILKSNLETTEFTTITSVAGLLLEPPFRTITIIIALYVGRGFFWKRGWDDSSGHAVSMLILWGVMLLVVAGASLLEDGLKYLESRPETQVKMEKIKEAPFTAEMLGITSSYPATITRKSEDGYVSLEYIQILDGGGNFQYTYRWFGEEAMAEELWASLHKRDTYDTENEWVHFSKEWVDDDLSVLGTENATVLLYRASNGSSAEFVSSQYVYNIQKGNVQLAIEYTQGLLTETQLQVIAGGLP